MKHLKRILVGLLMLAVVATLIAIVLGILILSIKYPMWAIWPIGVTGVLLAYAIGYEVLR